MNGLEEIEEGKKKTKLLEKQLASSEEALARCQTELAEWHSRALDQISGEEIISIVQKERVNSLSYDLLKAQNRIAWLEAELARSQKELDEVKNILKPSRDLDQRKKDFKPEAKPVDDSTGQKISASEILSEDELAGLLGMEEIQKELKKKESKTIKDFMDLLIRLRRVKVVDASILLNVDKGLMNVWIDRLKSKNLIRVEGGRDPILTSTDSLVKVRRMMK